MLLNVPLGKEEDVPVKVDEDYCTDCGAGVLEFDSTLAKVRMNEDTI